MTKGLAAKPGDAELTVTLNAALADVKSRVESQRSAAAATDPPAPKLRSYGLGVQQEEEANRLEKNHDVGGAIRRFSDAIAAYHTIRRRSDSSGRQRVGGGLFDPERCGREARFSIDSGARLEDRILGPEVSIEKNSGHSDQHVWLNGYCRLHGIDFS